MSIFVSVDKESLTRFKNFNFIEKVKEKKLLYFHIYENFLQIFLIQKKIFLKFKNTVILYKTQFLDYSFL